MIRNPLVRVTGPEQRLWVGPRTRERPYRFPAPTREEMNLFLIGRAGEAYRLYWKRTGCSNSQYWRLSHVFLAHAPVRIVKPTFPRRKGWKSRVASRKCGRVMLESDEPTTCRRCSECQNSKHHWIDNPVFGADPSVPEDMEDIDDPSEVFYSHICKHCPARGSECDDCDGDGIGEPCGTDEDGDDIFLDCPGCNGHGVIEGKRVDLYGDQTN